MRDSTVTLPRASAERPVVFFGNGIHRLSAGPSWEDLIIRLSSSLGRKGGDYELDFGKPFTLLYEELAVRAGMSRSQIEKIFANEVAKFSEELRPHELHKALLSLNISHYITTNYDLTLERAIVEPNKLEGSSSIVERRYSIFRRFTINGNHIWHIHGEIIHPGSIMLGYDHYAGALQKIREYTTTGAKYSGFNRRSLIARLSPTMTVSSWIDLFFISDIHILGISLNTVEMHLWWIIAFRARKAKEKNVENVIRYYHPKQIGIRTSREDERKLEMLVSFGVKIEEIRIPPRKWQLFYEESIAQIGRHC